LLQAFFPFGNLRPAPSRIGARTQRNQSARCNV